MLIKSPSERKALQETRHNQVLKFLRDETWTSPQVLAQLLGRTITSVTKTMGQLESLGFVIRHVVPELRKTLWGITAHGLAFSWADDEEMLIRPHFEPSRLAPLSISHHLDTQFARLQAEQAGWSQWLPGDRLPKGLAKRPDAVAVDPHGKSIAIEIERHVKTLKRYEAIFAIYLQSIKRDEYSAIHYICPSQQLAKQLTRVFGLIQAVPLLGERVPIGDKHRSKFQVFALENWPLGKL